MFSEIVEWLFSRASNLDHRHQVELDQQNLTRNTEFEGQLSLSILVKDPIKKTKNRRSLTFTSDLAEEMLMNSENYDSVFHRYTTKCFSTVDSDSQCQKSFGYC